jgi:uncharacterized membrane protein
MKHWERVLHGFIGGIAAIALVVVLLAFSRCFEYSSIYVLNNEKLDQMSLYVQNDSISLTKIAMIKELEAKGILLTPQEYTSNITSYYNTIIGFLIALFVVFSFIGYFAIRTQSKKDIQDQLNDMAEDSIKFRTTAMKPVLEMISDTFVTKEEQINAIDELREEILGETEASLDEIREQIHDSMTSGETVVES